MPIQEGNIVFLKSQVMDDVPEGGGAATGNVVPDGVMNNVFEDISDLDRAYGRFNLRKMFLAVRSLSTDLYGGAKVAITQLPVDPALGYALFTTEDHFDQRTDASNRVEAYLYKGPLWHGVLHETHIAGMQAIAVLQMPNTLIPPIGKTLCLVQNEGAPDEIEQYVRVNDVTVTPTTFDDGANTFLRWVVMMTLSDPLRYDFMGHSATKSNVYSYSGKTRIRNTTVANATKYYGASALATAAAIGDLKVQAASLYTQLVPSAQAELALVAQPMAGSVSAEVNAGSHTVSVPQTAHTRAVEITAENRRLTWLETLKPIPAAGTLTISYLAEGNWYLMVDDGAGVLGGDDVTIGAGTLSYTTGVANITLGALPDTGSQIMFAWGSGVHYAIRTGATVPKASIRHALGESVEPGTLVLTWLERSVEKTATSTAAGDISGNGCTGRVLHGTGDIYAEWATYPDPSTSIRIDYERCDQVSQTLTGMNDAGGFVSFTLTQHPIREGTLCLKWSLTSKVEKGGKVMAYVGVKTGDTWVYTADFSRTWENDRSTIYETEVADDGAGEIGAAGTVNYTSGAVVLQVLPEIPAWKWADGAVWETHETGTVDFLTGIVQASYVLDSVTPAAKAVTVALPAPVLKFGGTLITDTLVPEGLRFTWNGWIYRDYGDGTVYRCSGAWNDASATLAGAINYSARTVTLSSYATGSGAVEVLSCLTRYGLWVGTEACFRTQAAPLKPEALSIFVTAADGEQLTASADENGDITGDQVEGAVNYEFGTATMRFGEMVDEEWVPREVDPSTLRYNAVSYNYLPLDADILGIDPVRMPSDGRTPIYHKGDVVLVMHTAETNPATLADGGMVNCGRTRLAWVRVIDEAGATVPGTAYHLDRAAGVLTFPSVVGIDMPIHVRHTIADLRMVSDAQISGWLTLTRGLSHAFPAGESMVSSCLIFGDRRARVSGLWDQQSWTNLWEDSLIGSAANATLNTIDFPVTVTNEGCDTERWVFRCTNATNAEWELWGEMRGLVWSGTFPAYESGDPVDVAPINPRTRTEVSPGVFEGGSPYLTIPQRGNGGGWSTGNCVRINTVGAIADFWIARSIQQSDEPADDGADGCELYALGNVDRP